MDNKGLLLPGPLVSNQWLYVHLDNPNLIVLDGSMNAPVGSSASSGADDLKIPKTRYFDLDGRFSLPESDLPHMMPSEHQFNLEARKLGISNGSVIVVYDSMGIYSSPRIWWMFKAMGHQNVAVLDGGLPKWKEQYPCESAGLVEEYPEGDFSGKLDTSYFHSASEVLGKIQDTKSCLLDARSAGRFQGIEPEPRAGLRGGHIPNALNLPFSSIVRDHQMVPTLELQSIFNDLDLKGKSIIFSCGSGLTACILTLGASILGYSELSVYDGSWTEWGRPSGWPLEK
ncbi:MAG: sulfurtransferase [Cyclobacteriaceae bacterium]